jgi:hypothetical protein
MRDTKTSAAFLGLRLAVMTDDNRAVLSSLPEDERAMVEDATNVERKQKVQEGTEGHKEGRGRCWGYEVTIASTAM